ncbi:MAG: UbiH/UbiF/VisC/COQ6 family ubiquinone biosynthesis hydroxylase [Alphaproteobacteria bacterium]|nr:UbiH/UbiF/VisC/COQ6 family ubiquinone biosynthesis hydroxylase [Alphaproteobacteria bacterium]
MKRLDHPITVVGGGHTGLSLSIILGLSGLDVVCIDSENPKDFNTPTDKRTTVISHGSSKILKRTGVWEKLQKEACPIKHIDVLDGSRSPIFLSFLDTETQEDAFGWVVENSHLRKELYQKIKKIKNVTLLSETKVTRINHEDERAIITCDNGQIIDTDLVIGADGRRSFVRGDAGISTRNWSYDQNAIICTVEHEHDHQNKAVEHFYSEGPFAILPMKAHKKGKYRSYIVWTEEKGTKTPILSYDEETFNHALNARFANSYGKVKAISDRFCYPLTFSHAHSYFSQNTALVGDAAHGIHPIAGQGLNLGLRDIDCLSDILIDAHNKGKSLNDSETLKAYETTRRPDNTRMIAMTDTLNQVCSSNSRSLKILRSFGLRAVSKIKPTKNFFMKQAMGEK